jgi:hypothetical protein
MKPSGGFLAGLKIRRPHVAKSINPGWHEFDCAPVWRRRQSKG